MCIGIDHFDKLPLAFTERSSESVRSVTLDLSKFVQ